MKLNIHLYQSTITNESRILKITQSLARKDYFGQIHIVGLHDKGLPTVEDVSEKIKIIRIRNIFHTTNPASRIRYLTLIEWNIRLFFLYLFKNVRCINAHSVPVLPVSFFLKRMKRCVLIYDTHELETETETEGFGKKLSKWIERMFIGAADRVIVVGESIRKWYENEYQLRGILTIKNIPHAFTVENRKELKSMFGISDNEVLFIYQGNLSGLRGVNEIISVFQRVPRDKHILFMGFGSLKDKIEKLSREESNIHYHPAVSPSELLSYTAGADIGIHIIPNTCLNNYYCLPNKLFEYVLAGIPFVGSDFPDIRSEFGDRRVAWLIHPDEQSLEKMVMSLTKEQVDSFRNNALSIRSELTWENQEPVLYKLYDDLFGAGKLTT